MFLWIYFWKLIQIQSNVYSGTVLYNKAHNLLRVYNDFWKKQLYSLVN